MRACPGFALGLFLAALAGAQESRPAAQAPEEAAATRAEIDRLIRDLGNDDWAVRDAATRRLRRIASPAAPALREALRSPDAEIRDRAESLLDVICCLTPAGLEQNRAEARTVFRAADYAAAIRVARGPILCGKAEAQDWLWYGHACQLAGKWADAVGAYQKCVELTDEDLRKGIKQAPAAGGGLDGPGPVVVHGPVPPAGAIPLNPSERKSLLNQRSVLSLWIARMQAAELKDPKAAERTLADALDCLEASRTEIDHVWRRLAAALPPMAHEAKDVAGAIAAWKRHVGAMERSGQAFEAGQLVDVELIHKALRSLPADAPRPEVPWILFFRADELTLTLDLSDADTRAHAYRRGVYEHYALAPPRGKEFAEIEFACDIEQLVARWGGQFSCFVAARDPPGGVKELGTIGWTIEGVGRTVLKRTIAIPPGAGLVHIRVGRPKAFIVHSVSARATFRPEGGDPAPTEAGAWMQTELHPADGALTWGEMALQHDRAYSGVRAGRHTLRFTAPHRSGTIERPFEVKPGRSYGLFFDFDSPFRWQQLPLEVNGDAAGDKPRLSIQPLAEGGYLAVWHETGGRLMAARSEDLVRWTPPEPLPFSSVFDNIEPATFRAPDGTIYLAFFSNRICLGELSTGVYLLWLTHTRDGRTWAPIRWIEAGTLDGWPLSSPAMLAGPDGKQWLFWRDRAGSAEALDGVDVLTPIHVQDRGADGEQVHLWDVHVVADDRRQFHMVCSDFGQGIYSLRSEDGRSWRRPRLLVEKKQGGPEPTDPQLILADGRALLLYGEAYLCRADPEAGPISAGEGVRVSCRLVPLAGARLFRRGDEVLVTAGTKTTWLLRAKVADLLSVTRGK